MHRLLGKLGVSSDGLDEPLTNVRGVVDANTPAKLSKFTTKILVLASNKKINLKNSPPYLLVWYGIESLTGRQFYIIVCFRYFISCLGSSTYSLFVLLLN